MKTLSIVNRNSSLPLLAALLTMAGLLQADINLQNNTTGIVGPIEVRMDYTDTNGNGQDLQLAQLPSTVSQALPGATVQLQNTPILQGQTTPNGYFDQLWNSVSADVCGELAAQVPALVHSSQNQAYNVSCTPGPQGLLLANIANDFTDANGLTVVGTRLTLDYWAPFTSVVFTVTTPTTCSNANLVCAADPKFTAIFQVHIIVTATTLNSNTLILPPDVKSTGTLVLDSVLNGDQGTAVQNAISQFTLSVAESVAEGLKTGEFDYYGLAIQAANTLAQLAGIGISDLANANLNNQISQDLSTVQSVSVAKAATQAGNDFDNLYQGLAAAGAAGFSQIGVTAGNDGSLIFRMTYPQPQAPKLGTTATPGQNFNSPTIGSGKTGVEAGQSIAISGSNFSDPSSTSVTLNWNPTVNGKPGGVMHWGLSTSKPQATNVSGFTYSASNLTPGKSYKFQVQECDPITCAPLSNTVTFSTAAAGASQVTFALDKTSDTIGSKVTIGANGSFSSNVTIPAGTATGPHTLFATAGSLQASMKITVCGSKGCAPSLVEVNPTTGLAYAPGQIITQNNTIKLAVANFTPGQTVTFSFDSFSGTKIGFGTVKSDGTFEGSFTVPFVPAGNHNIVATGAGVGPSVTATFAVFVDANN